RADRRRARPRLRPGRHAGHQPALRLDGYRAGPRTTGPARYPDLPGGLLRRLPVSDPEALLRIAVNAAGEAGRLLASWRGDERPEVVDPKWSPTDGVTEMARRSEALITEWIRAVRPGDTILGEEGGQTLGGPDAVAAAGDQARVRWVVDPLDGTVNYLYGLPDWAVSIAAEVDGTILAGVVQVPRFGETFTAVAGRGAWLHRGGTAIRLRCAAGTALGQALVATGFGYDAGRRQVQGEVVAA